ncbi:MAG TPA: glycosyltransferase family 2 protein [Elusimicrobiota bacterium]|nr:glycosyltransferase family 2 protein [Elusimicrobiota bacterium]
MNGLKASVVIPVHNAARDAAALIDGVRATGLRGYEIIVVDDGSSDGTSAACAAKEGVRVVTLAANGGPARARNVGAAAARGEVLIFLDADVVLPRGSDVLRGMVEVLDADPSVDFVVTISDARPVAPSAVAYNYSVYHAYYMERLLGGREEVRGRLMFFTTRLGAIRREKFRRAGGFYESLRTVMNEDGEFGTRCWHLGYRGCCRADLAHSHRYATGFGRFARNYFLTAMVQAFISAKMDTSPDPSVAAPERARRLLAFALLLSPLLLLRLPARLAWAVVAGLLLLLLASFGRLHALVRRSVPARDRPAWYLVYVAITPAILFGYLYGRVLHVLGLSPLRGRPSESEFFTTEPAA